MKAVQLLVESAIPPELRREDRKYDAKGLNDLLGEVARTHPKEFADIAKKIADIGRHASYRQGESLGLEDLAPVFDKHKLFDEMDAKVAELKKTSRNPEEFEKKRMRIWMDASEQMEKRTMSHGVAAGNNIAYSIFSGARGKSPQLKAMITGPGIYEDANDDPINIFARNSHAEGIRPAEFLASTYGARSAIISTKAGTAKGGDIGKQLTQLGSNLVVTSHDCGTDNGLHVSINDDSLKYRVLAKDTGGLKAGTVLDARALAHLHRTKVKDLIVRSPLTCTAPEGVCSKCVGAMHDGHLYHVGSMAGVTSANALGEPLAQQALNKKHLSGMGSARKTYAGLDRITQFVQSPEAFPDRAAVAEHEGSVENIEDAPQGGKYIHIGKTPHYVLPGQEALVQKGEKVEKGDVLSDGLADPEDILRLRGLGEARLYYARRLKQILDDSGIKTDQKHTEMIARNAINRVNITDPDGYGDYLPDDSASYNHISARYAPPSDTKAKSTHEADGMYLQHPALHFTIGTKLSKKMLGQIKGAGIDSVYVSKEAPGFEPEMTRLRTAGSDNPDWFAKLQTNHLARNLQHSSARGEDTNIKSNISFGPRLAYGVGFGADVGKTGKF